LSASFVREAVQKLCKYSFRQQLLYPISALIQSRLNFSLLLNNGIGVSAGIGGSK
jgi:hypothetical protein